ncbi:MAG: nitroreductase family protein [Candidatus Methylomirabilales bacterium]
MNLQDVVRRRGMVRRFVDRPVEETKLARILANARRGPSAGFTQPVELIVVSSPTVRRRLVEAAWGQAWTGAAPVTLAVCADTRRSGRRYGERGVARYSVIDAAFASMLILLTAVDEGLGACFVGAFDDEAVREILGIPPHVLPVGLIPIGYPAESPPRYHRRPTAEVVHGEQW